MNIKLFHGSTRQAMFKANELAESIRKKKRTIALRNQDGTVSNELLEFNETQVDPIDDGVAGITLIFEATFNFT